MLYYDFAPPAVFIQTGQIACRKIVGTCFEFSALRIGHEMDISYEFFLTGFTG